MRLIPRLAFSILLLSPLAYGQNDSPDSSYRLPFQEQYLQLTPEQINAIADFKAGEYKKYIDTQSGIYALKTVDEINAANLAFLKTVLTPKQFKLEKLAQEFQQKFMEAVNSSKNPQIEVLLMQSVSEEFQLSEKQIKNLKLLQEDFRQDCETAKEHFRVEVKILRKKSEEQLVAILTDQQMADYKELFGNEFEFQGEFWQSTIGFCSYYNKNPSNIDATKTTTLADNSVLVFLWPAKNLSFKLVDELAYELCRNEDVANEINLTPEQLEKLKNAAPKWSDIERKNEVMELKFSNDSNYDFPSEAEKSTGKSHYEDILRDSQIRRLRQIFRQFLVHLHGSWSNLEHPSCIDLLGLTQQQSIDIRQVINKKNEQVAEILKQSDVDFKAIHKKSFQQVFDCLNEAQKKKYLEILQVFFPVEKDPREG